MKQTNISEAVKIIIKNIKSHKGVFTLNDASATTGLAVHEVQEALEKLLEIYTCRLQVTDSGDLIYNFGIPLKRKNSKTFFEVLSDIGNFLWKIFTVFFKAWITVTLVVYFVIFVVIIILLIIGLMAGSKGKGGKSIRLGWIGRMFTSIFFWRTYNNRYDYRTDRDGYRYRQYESKKALLDLKNEGKKNFIACVYDFVFGPPRVELDPLANEKEVAAYLRKKKGVITVSELVALAGWSFDEAEKCISDYVSRFRGSVEFTENNVMYVNFEDLLHSRSDYQGGKIEYYWNEYEPPFKITGNTFGKNALIIFMNSLNLIMGLVFFNSQYFINLFASYGIPPALTLIVLGAVPASFSITFFLIPLMRIPGVLFREKKRKAENKRKRLVKVLFDSLENGVSIENAHKTIASQSEKTIEVYEINKIMDKLELELRGEKDWDDSGNFKYFFNRIRDDYKDVELLRQKINPDSDPGKIVFDA